MTNGQKTPTRIKTAVTRLKSAFRIGSIRGLLARDQNSEGKNTAQRQQLVATVTRTWTESL